MTVLAAVAQFNGTANVARNLTICTGLITQAAALGAKMVFLPEASDYIAHDHEEMLELAESLEGPFLTAIRKVARTSSIWVSLGVHEADPKLQGLKCHNTHVVVDNQGIVQQQYRKPHLFDIALHGKPVLVESAYTARGTELVMASQTPLGSVGLGTCYDLRFPEMATALRQQGANILTYPSAFTVKTGSAHWEPLLRARAIETQCYVIAAAQNGRHNAKRESYGHAMIVDPWGTIVAQCHDTLEPTLAVAPIDLTYQSQIRKQMPISEHRRIDLFPWLAR
ncbi:Carbon-nitrogen hydrolase [Dimargaris xerosporica]|nr:Carbon-nitrogen hydrolase [Dimargaris xerosporica]